MRALVVLREPSGGKVSPAILGLSVACSEPHQLTVRHPGEESARADHGNDVGTAACDAEIRNEQQEREKLYGCCASDRQGHEAIAQPGFQAGRGEGEQPCMERWISKCESLHQSTWRYPCYGELS